MDEQVQERAERKLFLDAMVIQRGHLSEQNKQLSNEDLLWLFCWLPPVLIFLEESGSMDEEVLIASFVMCAIYIGTLLLRALHAYRKSIVEIRANPDTE